MGARPAHHPRVRLHLQRLQARPLKNFSVGPHHRLVTLLCSGFIGIKAIRILHQELFGPHQAEPRPDLVPVLGLDLIERPRQLPVTLHLTRH